MIPGLTTFLKLRLVTDERKHKRHTMTAYTALLVSRSKNKIVWGSKKSLEIAPFDTAHMSSY